MQTTTRRERTMTRRYLFTTRSRDEANASHSGLTCRIIRELTDDERDREVGPMFTVRFPDGFQVDAFHDELTPAPESATLWFAGGEWVSR
jgi:hypothetical protein